MGAQHWQASTATARGAVGIKTAIGTIIAPKSATKITAIWCQIFGGALLTTAEASSGILELDSADINGPLQFPTDQVNMLTGGSAQLPTHIIPTNIPIAGGASIVGSITFDDTVTGACLCRWGMCTE
jgi:hypothetical protein